MASISAEYVRSRVGYDPRTGVLTWKPKSETSRIDKMWNTRFAGKTITHHNSSGHIHFGLDGKNYLGHRIAWLIMTGEWPFGDLDHANRVRDDNRWCNLREATRPQNTSNTKHYRNNTSGYRGVWWQGGKWVARIRSRGHRIFLGAFDDLEEAAIAYDKAASSLHGEFASLNFGIGDSRA